MDARRCSSPTKREIASLTRGSTPRIPATAGIASGPRLGAAVGSHHPATAGIAPGLRLGAAVGSHDPATAGIASGPRLGAAPASGDVPARACSEDGGRTVVARARPCSVLPPLAWSRHRGWSDGSPDADRVGRRRLPRRLASGRGGVGRRPPDLQAVALAIRLRSSAPTCSRWSARWRTRVRPAAWKVACVQPLVALDL